MLSIRLGPRKTGNYRILSLKEEREKREKREKEREKREKEREKREKREKEKKEKKEKRQKREKEKKEKKEKRQKREKREKKFCFRQEWPISIVGAPKAVTLTCLRILTIPSAINRCFKIDINAG